MALYQRFLEALHALGAIGFMGGLATCVVLMASLQVVLMSGLLARIATEACKNAGWAWMKALLGVVTFAGTLLTIVGNGRKAAEYAAAQAACSRVRESQRSTCSNSCAGSSGFGRWSSMPAAKHVARSSSNTMAVIATIGVRA